MTEYSVVSGRRKSSWQSAAFAWMSPPPAGRGRALATSVRGQSVRGGQRPPALPSRALEVSVWKNFPSSIWTTRGVGLFKLWLGLETRGGGLRLGPPGTKGGAGAEPGPLMPGRRERGSSSPGEAELGVHMSQEGEVLVDTSHQRCRVLSGRQPGAQRDSREPGAQSSFRVPGARASLTCDYGSTLGEGA